MKKFLAGLLFLACVGFAPTLARADGGCVIVPQSYAALTNIVYFPVCDASGNLRVSIAAGGTTAAALATCLITTAIATVCKSAVGGNATQLVGFYNNAPTAQTATITCFDNATIASGSPFFVGALGISQVITMPSPGRTQANGVVCLASAAPTGNGIEVYVR